MCRFENLPAFCTLKIQAILIVLSLPKGFFLQSSCLRLISCFRSRVFSVFLLKSMSPLIMRAIHFQNDGAFNLLLVSPEEC